MDILGRLLCWPVGRLRFPRRLHNALGTLMVESTKAGPANEGETWANKTSWAQITPLSGGPFWKLLDRAEQRPRMRWDQGQGTVSESEDLGLRCAQPVTSCMIVEKLLCSWVKWGWQFLPGLPSRTTRVDMKVPGQLSCAYDTCWLLLSSLLVLLMKVMGGAGGPRGPENVEGFPRWTIRRPEAPRGKRTECSRWREPCKGDLVQPGACWPWLLALIKAIIRLGCLLKQKPETFRSQVRIKVSANRLEELVFN